MMRNWSRRKRFIAFLPLFVVGAAVFVALGGWVVELLWNNLLPPLFGWPQVGFWQALGLLVLCRILFGGLGHGGGPRRHLGRRMAARWEAMTPEERERFRQAFRDRHGFDPSPTEGAAGQ